MTGNIVILPAKMKIPFPHCLITLKIFIENFLFRPVHMQKQAHLPYPPKEKKNRKKRSQKDEDPPDSAHKLRKNIQNTAAGQRRGQHKLNQYLQIDILNGLLPEPDEKRHKKYLHHDGQTDKHQQIHRIIPRNNRIQEGMNLPMKKKYQRIIQNRRNKLNDPQADHDKKIIPHPPPETRPVKHPVRRQSNTVKNNLEKRRLRVTGNPCIQKKNPQKRKTAKKRFPHKKTRRKRPAEKENHGGGIAQVGKQVD